MEVFGNTSHTVFLSSAEMLSVLVSCGYRNAGDSPLLSLQVIKTDNPPTVVGSVWSLKRTYVFDMTTETLVSRVLDVRGTGRHVSNAWLSVELQNDEMKYVQTVCRYIRQ